jgi:hypothetical protein
MRRVPWLATLVLGAALAACAPRYGTFTHGMRTAYGVDDARLRAVQFYTSTSCSFERQIDTRSGEVARGAVRMRSGRAIDVVRIPRHTPGVVEQVGAGAIGVSFAAGNTLDFGVRLEEGPASRYYLLGRYDPLARLYVVRIAGQDYYQTSKAPCTLSVRRSRERSHERRRRTLPGRRLDE